jgi:transcriptional regulator with XRE-family HTH domain
LKGSFKGMNDFDVLEQKTREIFADRIKKLREGKGLSVRGLAAELGIGNSSLSQYENCKRTPGLDICKMFADYFNVSVDYLAGFTDEPRKGK